MSFAQAAEPLTAAGAPYPLQAATPAEPEKPGMLLDRVVAIVNDGVVMESELDEQTAVITRAPGAAEHASRRQTTSCASRCSSG